MLSSLTRTFLICECYSQETLLKGMRVTRCGEGLHLKSTWPPLATTFLILAHIHEASRGSLTSFPKHRFPSQKRQPGHENIRAPMLLILNNILKNLNTILVYVCTFASPSIHPFLPRPESCWFSIPLNPKPSSSEQVRWDRLYIMDQWPTNNQDTCLKGKDPLHIV